MRPPGTMPAWLPIAAVLWYAALSILLGDAPWNPVDWGLAFNSMTEHLLAGRFDIDVDAIGPEAFSVDGRTVAYFGVFPALLRVPLLAGGVGGVDVTGWSCLAALAVAAWFTTQALRLVWPSPAETGTRRAWLVPALAVAILFGGPRVQFLRPSLYQEPIDWGTAEAAAFLFLALRGLLTRQGLDARTLAAMATCAGLAMLTRVSFGIGLCAALGFLALTAAWRAAAGAGTGTPDITSARHQGAPPPEPPARGDSPWTPVDWSVAGEGAHSGVTNGSVGPLPGNTRNERDLGAPAPAEVQEAEPPGGVRGKAPARRSSTGGPGAWLAAAGVLAGFGLVTAWVNYGRWGHPLVFADYTKFIATYEYYPGRLAHLAAYGNFHPARLLLGLLYYFAPVWIWLRADGHVLFAEAQARMMDAMELPPGSFLLTDPLLLCLAPFGLRDRRALAIAAGLAIPPLLMLIATSMTHRYRMEFYGLLIFLALLGTAAPIWAAAATRRFRTLLLSVTLLSVIAAHAAGVLAAWAPFGPGEFAVERFGPIGLWSQTWR